MLEAMSLNEAQDRGLLTGFRRTFPGEDCWIVWNHTTKRDVYFGNKAGAKYKVDGDLSKYFRATR